MKNKVPLWGVVLIAAALCFACENEVDDDTGSLGTISIMHNNVEVTVALINTPLTAVYNGKETIASWQWNKDGSAISGANSAAYTPIAAGGYTVTAAASDTTETSDVITIIDINPNGGISAVDLVAAIKTGWNLGNTLDCSDLGWLGSNPSAIQMETAWGNPATTQENVTALKTAGFNAIRIPVSWAKAADSNYNIRADWMERVKQIVDYAVNQDMYIVLNTHHDEDIFKFQNDDTEKSLKAFKKIWEQIAAAFKDYGDKLVFEGLNEPRTKGSSAEWQGGTADERANLNKHYQVFVDAVRASGGNNGTRVLMVNSYGASGEAAALNGLTIPRDVANGKIIASYHAYAPYNFALNTNNAYDTWSASSSSDTSAITSPINRAATAFVDKGIPVVIGEFGAMNKDNSEARSAWAEYYVKAAKDKGMPCFWWDNGVTSGTGERFGLLDRRTNQFIYEDIVAALMRGAGN